MEKVVIQAEVYRVIRANQHLSVKAVMKLICEHLPDITKEELSEALDSLKD